MKRVIWIILDSVGMGEAPDAAAFGDAGSSTIPHTWEYNKGLNIPNLLKLGLGNIDGMKSLPVMDEYYGWTLGNDRCNIRQTVSDISGRIS